MIGCPTGWIHLHRKDYKQAEEIFLALTHNPASKNDPYSLLGLAIINMASVPPQRRKVHFRRFKSSCIGQFYPSCCLTSPSSYGSRTTNWVQ